jgi:hypothetical protein
MFDLEHIRLEDEKATKSLGELLGDAAVLTTYAQSNSRFSMGKARHSGKGE